MDSLPEQSEWLVVAETRGAADDFARGATRGRSGLFGAHRMTLRQLASALATEPATRSRLAAVSRLGMEAVAARSVFACRSEKKLRYFAPVADTPGFPRALAATLTELRLHGVSRQALSKSGPPGEDLARLLARYESELADRSLADMAILFRLAAETAAGPRRRFLDLPLFLVDCSIQSASERDFVQALAGRSPQIVATAPIDDDRSIKALEQILQTPAASCDLPGAPQAIDRLRTRVFTSENGSAGAKMEFDSTVEFFSAAGEALECVEIARRIRRLAATGTPFDRVAILLRHPDAYLPLVEDALRRAGIPAYFTRSAARPEPSGRAFLALLACAAEGLTATRFAEYLSLGQVPEAPASADWVPPQDEILSPAAVPDPQPPAPGPHRPAPDWERLLVDAAVVGGRDRWSRRLRGLEAEYRLQLQALDHEGDPRRAHLEARIEKLERLENFALPLIDFLGSLPASAPWRDWLDQLSRLAEMALRQPDSVLSVLNELQPMEQVGPVGLDEVRTVLADCLGFLRRDPPQRRYGRVFVGAIAEARGRSFEVVFLPGLAEGLFPRKMFEDPLLLDEYRLKLAAGLPLEHDRVAAERLLLRLAAGAARSRFIASYPRMDVTIGRPRVPSFYALEIWRAVEGRLPDLAEMEKRAAQAAPSQLGWPAPIDPGESIDDTEYDLAFLSQLLREHRERDKGTGRYLLDANPHLARSLRARWRRWNRSWSEADGLVDPDAATLEVLGRHGIRQRPYSPTALQQFAACPYRFLLYAIHQLRPREEAVALEQLDPLTRGGLFHAVQFELFRALTAAALLPISAAKLGPVLDLADQTLNRVAAEYEEKLAPAIPRVWQSSIEEIRTDLRGWIFELANLSSGWQPAHFEFSFGLAADWQRDAASRPDPAIVLDAIQLRGLIDLVEKDSSRNILRVTDHKTGKAPDPPPRWVGNGEILQPLLYGLAAEAMLGQKVESGLLFYATQRGNYTRVEIPLTADARLRAAHVLQTIDEAIQQGFLPAAPRPNACEYCDYRPVCGPYEELRVKRKNRDPLETLNALRSLP